MLTLRCAYCGKPVSVEDPQLGAPKILGTCDGETPIVLCTMCTVLWYTSDSNERRVMKHAIFFGRNAADLFPHHAWPCPAGAA